MRLDLPRLAPAAFLILDETSPGNFQARLAIKSKKRGWIGVRVAVPASLSAPQG